MIMCYCQCEEVEFNFIFVLFTVFHEQIYLVGCSDTVKDSYKEDMYALDGEVLVFADFNKGKAVEPQPPFVDHMTWTATYEAALNQQALCKHNLDTIRTAMKKPPVKGTWILNSRLLFVTEYFYIAVFILLL